MPKITIEVSDDVAAKLSAQALAVDMDVNSMLADIAIRTAALPDMGGWDPRLSAEDIAAIKIGIAEANAGKLIPHEQVMQEVFGAAHA